MIRWLYTLLFYLAVPFVLLRLLWRARKAPAYARRWWERFGWVPRLQAKNVIWVHSVSVGETLAAVPLIKSLQQRYSNAQLVVTTMTPTGSERVTAIFGNTVYHVYAPYDLPGAIARFLDRIKPDLLIIMETELWPNLLASCNKRSIPVVLANARLSEKSASAYARLPGFTRSMLANLSVAAAQHSKDGNRFCNLGLPKERCEVTGNIKFDLELAADLTDKASALRHQWQGQGVHRPVFLAASTHRGEDEQVLNAFAKILQNIPKVLLILVPRHPERFDEVAELCENRGFQLVRRSNNGVPAAADQILLGDTMGELLAFCGASDVVFVGGSLVPVGGHNLIEPAAWAAPVLSGPHLFNFSEASQLLLNAGGMQVCENGEEMATAVIQLLNDESRRKGMGHAAKMVADQNRGALQKLLSVVDKQLQNTAV